jgi:tetratricopeptide (TPR) repeat protein
MDKISSIATEFNIETPEQLAYTDTLLLVEDQNDLRLILAHHLQKAGFKSIKQCSEGHEAVKWLEENPDKAAMTIAAMDMPLIGGIELLNEMRDQENLGRSPFVLMMSNPDKAKIMLATENTVDGILAKPFSFNDVIPKIRRAFKVYHNPQNPELVYDFAKKALREQRLDEAQSVYTRLSEATTKAARPYVGLAWVAQTKGDTDRALTWLDQAQIRNHHYVPIYVMRGQLRLAKGEQEAAIEQFRKAIELSPLNPLRYEEAAKLLFRMKKYQEAIELLNIALQHELQFPALYHYLSQAHFALNDYRKAIYQIRRALAFEPDNVVYLNQLGIAYKESEQFQEAIKTYHQVLKSDPDNKAALYNKSVLLHARGKVEEAIKLLSRCLTKHPDFTQARAKLEEYQQSQAG